MKSSQLLLCLDLGSSACKGALIDETGHVVAEHRAAFPPLQADAAGQVEQEPEKLWEMARQCCARLLAGRTRAAPVAGIGISAQMSTHMLVAPGGMPLTRFISWADARAQRECDDLSASFSREQLATELGAALPVLPSWALPRLRWWRLNRPSLLDRARYLVQPKDWIIWKLCGNWASDLSSLRGLTHQESGRFSPALANWAGVATDLAPPIAAPDAMAGMLRLQLAREWNLARPLPVFVGWNDLASAVIGGAGIGRRPVGFDLAGTSEHLGICYAAPGLPKPLPSLSDIPLMSGHRLRYGVTSSSGRTLQWYWERYRREAPDAKSYRKMAREAGSIPPGSEGLIFLPCLEGERAPWFNARARGGFHDLSTAHGSAHFSRAVLEGIAFTLLSIYRRLGLDASVDEFRVLGGGSALVSWNQMKADIFQKRMVTLECAEAGCLGAAITAAKGLGWHRTWAAASRAFVRTGRVYEPEKKAGRIYEKQHARFETICRAMEPLWNELPARGGSA